MKDTEILHRLIAYLGERRAMLLNAQELLKFTPRGTETYGYLMGAMGEWALIHDKAISLLPEDEAKQYFPNGEIFTLESIEAAD